MFKRLIVFIIFLFPLLQFSQDFSALWEGHFSYNNIKDVSRGNNKIYAAAENAVFSLDIQTNEIEKLTTVNGLSGETISTIYYSEVYELLVIGYENGLIEVAFDNDDDILSVVDILDKITIPAVDKRINHFNAYQNVIYISTNYGISVFDLERLEFGDTYFIGNGGSQIQVNQTTIFGDYIYAACLDGSGLRKGLISNPNLIDYQNWQLVNSGNWLLIESQEDKLYAIGTNRRIYQIVNDVLTEMFLYTDTPLDMRSVNGNLIVTTQNDVFVYDANFNIISQISINPSFDTQYNSAILDSENIYIGTKDFGILKTSLVNPMVFEEIHPDGPLLNSPFSIEAEPNGLWVTFGDYTTRYNPSPMRMYGISHLNGEAWHNSPYDSLFNSRNLNKIAINPFNSEQVFVSSFQDGLLEINNNKPTIRYDQANSGLESLVLSGNPSFISLRVSGLAFDTNGLLWSITSLLEKPLKSYNPSNNQWTSYNFSELINDPIADNLGFNSIVIDPLGTKFITSFSKGVIGFNENGNLLKSISEEEVGFPIKSVRALAIDNRGQLWIGTHAGLRVLYNTSSFFTDDNVRVEEVIIEEDGIAKELLAEQFISDIKVDGSNNKWISTIDSGVFYLSSDGQKTIFHFTKDNSPLPSNDVNYISIDGANGIVYIATSKGLVSFRSGGSSPFEDLENAYAYPNPVRPTFNIVEEKVKIKDVSENVNIKITDIEGNLVAEAQSRTNQRHSGYNLEIDGGTAYWNGKNMANNVVASGVYLIMLSDLDSFETKVLKLMVVR
ncbi:two-component regulator propeller domain-containing protein [Flavivirga spongiicola]|uniref:ABC transporter substrate-binding protein n=1 Tax=Flavivirga spongiicola TaxID=421621 RepID=A0ABU7XSV2_9FLAO|nr:two-component regulator propeller domain-containing protein [Flavivirga sp. MEBiC05379]MDO5978645.1 two-component regulator propeller domain-containing protein [Flavivirga sp. MEBiC05379]